MIFFLCLHLTTSYYNFNLTNNYEQAFIFSQSHLKYYQTKLGKKKQNKALVSAQYS